MSGFYIAIFVIIWLWLSVISWFVIDYEIRIAKLERGEGGEQNSDT